MCKEEGRKERRPLGFVIRSVQSQSPLRHPPTPHITGEEIAKLEVYACRHQPEFLR